MKRFIVFIRTQWAEIKQAFNEPMPTIKVTHRKLTPKEAEALGKVFDRMGDTFKEMDKFFQQVAANEITLDHSGGSGTGIRPKHGEKGKSSSTMGGSYQIS